MPATAASGHDYLVTSSPAAGSTLTHPIRSVSLTFDAAVLDQFWGSDGLILTGPGASTRHYETACARVMNDTVTAPVPLGRPGRYTVAWRIVSVGTEPRPNQSEIWAERPQRPCGCCPHRIRRRDGHVVALERAGPTFR